MEFATLVLQRQEDETSLKRGIHACLAMRSLPLADVQQILDGGFANWAQVLTAHWEGTGRTQVMQEGGSSHINWSGWEVGKALLLA